MSKRFGRNQKRALREKIASLERQLSQLEGWTERYRQERNQLQNAIDEAAQVLGYHHAALPVQHSGYTINPAYTRNMHQAAPPPQNLWVAKGNDPISAKQPYELQKMLQLTVAQHKNTDSHHTHNMHYLARLGDSYQSVYCISEKALYETPLHILKGRFARHVAEQLAELFTQEIKARKQQRTNQPT